MGISILAWPSSLDPYWLEMGSRDDQWANMERPMYLSGNSSAAANVLLQEAHPGFHSVPH